MTTMTSAGKSAARLHAEQTDRRRIIGYWLMLMCLMVFAMVVLGGVTRLTHSGLSMVEWKPITGWLPPLTDAEWAETFAKYQQSPEYQKVNKGMSVDEFKSIFWFEFIHRVWGRLIGVAFFFPALFFVVKGWAGRALMPKLALMFVLGGLQGVLGWYMVKSGLVDRPDVSQYRLTAHLGMALLVYGYMFWVALGLIFPPRAEQAARSGSGGGFAAFLVGFVFLTLLSGGFVAGLDAGFAYNTFPLMDGGLWPDDFFSMQPWWINMFEHIPTVQFDHRLLAESVFVLVLVFWWRHRGSAATPRAGMAVNVLLLAMLVQVGLGIATLLLVVPVSIAAIHQAGAVVLLSAALWATFELRQSN